MKLSEIYQGQSDIEIEGIAIDSRKVKPGYMFFCLKGLETDGHRFIDKAIRAGAACIVHSEPIDSLDIPADAGSDPLKKEDGGEKPEGGPVFIKVDDTLAESGRVCDLFYGRPSQAMTMFGVTGTNGKSTTASIISDIYSRHEPCGYMGTISVRYGDYSRVPTLTTPDQVEVHETLKEMRDHGMEAVAMEVSSHGLAMHRTETVDFDCAVFTNLSYDHLDYHHTMEEYLKAKSLLFSGMKPDGTAVLNADDGSSFRQLAELCTCRYVSYGTEAGAGLAEDPEGSAGTETETGQNQYTKRGTVIPDYYAKDIKLTTAGTEFTLCYRDSSGQDRESRNGEVRTWEYPVKTNLVALYNIYNLLAATAAMHEMGMPLEDMIPLFRQIPQVDGRMEILNKGQDFTVIVDYAHTPDGFDKIFQFAAEATKESGSIYAVFGCAGKRDKVKRKVLGGIAGRYCEKVFVTEEDPRDETAEGIGKEIIAGIEESGGQWEFNADRGQAIRDAIGRAKTGDMVLILGKGDETYMYYEEGRRPYPGDNRLAEEALEELTSVVADE